MTIKQTCAALAATSALSAGVAAANDFADFDALTIVRSGTMRLDLPPAKALLLFTAPGEKIWIDDWDPLYLHGDGLETGTVFVTTNHGPNTYWLVSEFDRKNLRAKYARVTPDTYTGSVHVAVSDDGDDGSLVTIRYQMTGLSKAGNKKLRETYGMSEFAAMIQAWQRMIRDSRAAIDAHFAE